MCKKWKLAIARLLPSFVEHKQEWFEAGLLTWFIIYAFPSVKTVALEVNDCYEPYSCEDSSRFSRDSLLSNIERGSVEHLKLPQMWGIYLK